jgi:hypothetical protein
MIKAGVEAYRPYWADLADSIDGFPEKMVRDVWGAMVAEARRSKENQTHPQEQ